MTTVVKRLVILMCAYALIFCLAYAPICALQQHLKLLDYYVKQYFGCLVFFPPEKCQKSKYSMLFYYQQEMLGVKGAMP